MQKKAEKDYYKILGVSRNDPEVVITQAYRKLAMQYHPDKNYGKSSAEEKMKEINVAKDILIDPDKRKQYDNQRVEYNHANYNHKESGFKFDGVFNYFNKSLEELKELWVQAGIECKNAHKKMPLNHIYTSGGELKRKTTNGIHINDII
ncbi:MAG: J domain-containing protein [Nanoarchaeota archaeon]|nr:J domain-containing protein [Nanoarchaeota archaeon]